MIPLLKSAQPSNPQPQQPSPSGALYHILDELAEEELVEDLQAQMDFEITAQRLLELADKLGVKYDPEDPRGADIVRIIDSTGMDEKTSALMLAQKARKAARGWNKTYGPETLHRYATENERYLARPQ